LMPEATPPVDAAAPGSSGPATLRITGDPLGRELTNNQVSEKAGRSVVSIAVDDGASVSYVSGVVMSDRGYVITCSHAVESGELTVRVWDGTELSAHVVGYDEATDVAVLSVEGAELKAADFGDSDLTKVGETMYVFGCLPTGTSFMTDCIVSAIDGNVYFNGASTPLILTDASVRAWNTGGVLVNSAGKVVGIVDVALSAIYGEDSLCCAIPVKMAKPVIDELIEKGYVEGRPEFGLTLTDVPAAMSAYLGIPRGAMIASVHPNSEAYSKNLARGDVVIYANGSEITGVADFNRFKNSLQVGDTAVIGVFRAGTVYYVELTVQDSSEVR
ncbi:MAG: serine protease, partial [Oscillospiraceae bacterium]|nr:serine protease [Oscillospiraceae bacterium]